MTSTTIPLATISRGDPDKVNQYLNKLWYGLLDDEDMLDQLRSQGIDVSAIKDIEQSPFIAERNQDANGAGFIEGLLVGIAMAAVTETTKKLVGTLWDLYIKPKLENAFGKVEDPE